MDNNFAIFRSMKDKNDMYWEKKSFVCFTRIKFISKSFWPRGKQEEKTNSLSFHVMFVITPEFFFANSLNKHVLGYQERP